MSHRLPLKDIKFIADFAAFCRTKGDEAYDYVEPQECACCQFLRETGRAAEPSVIPNKWRDFAVDGFEFKNQMPEGMEAALVAEGCFGQSDAWTFSALAHRLEALLADVPVEILS